MPAGVVPRSPTPVAASPAGPSADAGLGESLPFAVVADFFERMRTARDRERRLVLVKKLWARYGRDTQPMFGLMRLMLPHCDAARQNYNIKEKLMAQIYVSMLGLTPESTDAVLLTEYKKPSSLRTSVAGAGDFPERAFAVMQHRCPTAQDLGLRRMTIADVNRKLSELAAADGLKAKEPIVRAMYVGMLAVEQKWMLRIVLKDMGLGIKEAGLLKLYHPDAPELCVCRVRETGVRLARVERPCRERRRERGAPLRRSLDLPSLRRLHSTNALDHVTTDARDFRLGTTRSTTWNTSASAASTVPPTSTAPSSSHSPPSAQSRATAPTTGARCTPS